MLGAIIGDIVGSVYEFESDKTKDFEFFTEESRLTDDSMMTIAVGCTCAKAVLSDEEDFKSWVSNVDIGHLSSFTTFPIGGTVEICTENNEAHIQIKKH